MYKLNPLLRSFWRTRKPYKILKGGRFSGKTHDAAGMAAYLARNYSLRFMCVRQFQKNIQNSVYTVVADKIAAAGWTDEFDIGVSTIRHKETGSEFLFYGMARNLKEIKGTEGVDVCWIEEGEGLTADQWAIIDPTLRGEDSEIWLLYNPNLITDFVEMTLPDMLGDSCIIKTINYPDNPFLAEKAKEKALRLKEYDVDEYNHIYLGVPRSGDDAAVIKSQWAQAAVDFHKLVPGMDNGDSTLGFDIADDGDDKCATTGRKGSIANFIDEWKAKVDELPKSYTRAHGQAKERWAKIIYDPIGVGAAAGGKFNELNAAQKLTPSNIIKHTKFQAGGGVFKPNAEYVHGIKNKDFFANLKAQAWWMVADRFRKTYEYRVALEAGKPLPNYRPDEMISIDSNVNKLSQLLIELSLPLRDTDANGRVKVESKKDLEKRGVPSPNLADSFIMAYAPVKSGLKINPRNAK